MPIHIKSISEFAQIAQQPGPRHPLIGIVNISNIQQDGDFLPNRFSFGFYTIGLKINLKGYLKYGRTHYDFQEGVLVFTAPYQVLSFDHLLWGESRGWYLLFDRSLLAHTPLETVLDAYHFFSYQTKEALHLSKEEENQLYHIFTSLYDEYNKSIDTYSKELLVSHLHMILTYSKRYYERQFILRRDTDSSLLTKFEQVLHRFCSPTYLDREGIPTVKTIASSLNLSPNYLSDALRSATGMGTQKHIHLHLIALAKTQLLHPGVSISEVAFTLGFESHTYFSRLFKKIEGVSPREYLEQHHSSN
ncbi:MAG: helix-turn-helix transcriptional regulator [Bacteroidota bacterium]